MKRVLMIGVLLLAFFPYCSVGQKFALPGVISTVTTPEEWPVLRERIYEKIAKTWGESPVPYFPEKNSFKEVSRFQKYGLTMIVYRFHVVDDSWDRGILVLPKDFDSNKKYPAVVAVHGTNAAVGADDMIDLETNRSQAYGVDLAKRGYVAFCPDHFAYGEHLKYKTQDSVYDEFESRYPKWTITGRHILGFIRSVDCIHQFTFIDTKKGIGVIGNSLGGRTALYLMAFDQRISSAVISTGVSPMLSNTYRGLNKIRRQERFYWDEVEKNANYIWDYTEMISLCAPRALMLIEPDNDPYNPFVEFTFRALFGALPVWKLLGHSEKMNFLMHGDEHDTIDEVREFGYRWFDRFLL